MKATTWKSTWYYDLTLRRAHRDILVPGTVPTPYSSLRHYRFDSSNRMMAAWHDTDLNEYGFVYDAAGERVVRYRIAEGSVQSATFSIRDESGNVLTRVDWVPQQIPGDPDLGYWQAPTHHVYSGRSSILRIEPQIGSTVFDADYTTLLRDHLGSMRAALTSDAPVDLVEYWPYEEIASDVNGIEERHLFTGHEREYLGITEDALLGLDYMHARYYSFFVGRFSSLDPVSGQIRGSQLWDRYAYSCGNPLSLIDPDGMEVEVATDKKGRVDKQALGLLVLVAQSPGGRSALTAIDNEKTPVRFSTGSLNNPAQIRHLERSKKTHKLKFGATGATRANNVDGMSDKADGSGELKEVSVQIDLSMTWSHQPNDKTGETTIFHEMYHVNDILDGKADDDIRRGDLPTNMTGPAEKYGTSMKNETNDLSKREAKKWLQDHILPPPEDDK